MIRLIVTDMDGTLLSDHETIHPDNVKAIQRAVASGVSFAVASGRGPRSIGRILTRHDIRGAHIIAVNGCQVVDPTGRMLRTHTLDTGTARESLRVYAENGLLGCLYAMDAVVYTTQAAADRISGKPGSLFGEEAIEKALASAALKTFCIHLQGQEAAFASAREACERLSGVSITSSWRDNFEVMPAGVNKGAALAELAGRLGVSRDEIIAFGDNENDLEMLSFAGYGFAMGNASPQVKAHAAYVTGDCGEGGVAQAIASFFRETSARAPHISGA